MRKSKSDLSVKKNKKSSSVAVKKKRKSSSAGVEKAKLIKKEQSARKSRWEEAKTIDLEVKKPESLDLLLKTGKEDIRECSRIKDLLKDKEKMVAQLFLTVSGKALEDIIPDYLRKRPIEELKRLCLVEIEKMTESEVLNLVSGKESSLFKEQETQTELSATITPAEENFETVCKKEGTENIASKETNVDSYQNQDPPIAVDEVNDDLGLSEGDAELLELEMRARAIRSLLKLKSNEDFDSKFLDGNEDTEL